MNNIDGIITQFLKVRDTYDIVNFDKNKYWLKSQLSSPYNPSKYTKYQRHYSVFLLHF